MSLFEDARLHRTTVSLPEMDYHTVQRLARRAGVPVARVIREALSRGLRSVADDWIAAGQRAVARRAELLRQAEALRATGEHEEAELCEKEASMLERVADTSFERAHE
ncbi:MAG: ribbon-helix-helix protein, CopG family [Gemmatimonadota bacterium]|nr:ribbon-helix-helix protein, CopG family [Spirochaetaceae bacterium]MDE2944919.1 ribbon-helix-helix protein, CopG family [Gemmatimonadota bacterium]